MNNNEKILCVCEGGNVRSVTLAYILKMNGIDALACGVTWNKSETVEMLFKWADKILIADKANILDKIPEQYHSKITDMEIGSDIWGQPLGPVVMQVCLNKLNEKFGTIPKT